MLGIPIGHTLSVSEVVAFENRFGYRYDAEHGCKKYKRCIIHGHILSNRQYCENKNNNYVVKCTSNRIVLYHNYLNCMIEV